MNKWILNNTKIILQQKNKRIKSLNHFEKNGNKRKTFMITKFEQANVRKRVQIECAVWHLDVGLAHPHERRNHEGSDCSSVKELHELGLIRRETVWFLSSRGK